MSYPVTFRAPRSPSWFLNAWDHIRVVDPLYEGDDTLARIAVPMAAWNNIYNSVIMYEKSDSFGISGHKSVISEFKWTVTFPTEQDYIWFVLRWS